MIQLNRNQRVALKRVFDRGPLYHESQRASCVPPRQMTFLQFRRSVEGYPGGDCVMVRWCNMWLGIEKDGYVHS